jgi:predicted permease
VATPERRSSGGIGGISTGGIIVIVGIIVMIIWSFWLGLIITLIGLIAFGGFARGRWY